MTLTVAIICGGRSGEHDVSLQSAWGIYQSLDRGRFLPLLVAIDHEGVWHAGEAEALLKHPTDPSRICITPGLPEVVPHRAGRLLLAESGTEAARFQVAFPIIHGTDGEDGALQGLLRLMDIPFAGADVLGSAVGMDKTVMKRLLAVRDVPMARWRAFRTAGEAEQALDDMVDAWGWPLFMKPGALGSSVGVARVTKVDEFGPALAEAFRYDSRVLVEEAINGREIECAVLGNLPPSKWPPRASLPGEVVPRRGFYSYSAKYLESDGADLHAPADLDTATVERVQQLALRVFEALDAQGLARVDLFLRPDGGLLVNEINTLPGFTPISMYPQLWDVSGLAYPDLLTHLVDLALEYYGRRKALTTRFDATR